MTRSCFVIVATLMLPPIVQAQGGFPAHVGHGFDFTAVDRPTDTHVVTDRGGNVDLYLYRSSGPIQIEIPVRRYVGPTDAHGHLLNVPTLVERGIITPTFTLRLPVYDVDTFTFPVLDCDGDGELDQLLNERDELYLNDEPVATLDGRPNLWMAMAFVLPIERLRFPAAPGELATNTVRVDIDVLNATVVLSSGAVGCETWATEVDWASVQFAAAAPVVLIHGILADGASLSELERGLESRGVPAQAVTLSDPLLPDPVPAGWETCADIPYNNSVLNNVAQLKDQVPAIAELFGSSALQLVAHSKGGLDGRVFLSLLPEAPIAVKVGEMSGEDVTMDLRGESLVTLNSPHDGSVLAELGVSGRIEIAEQAVATGSLSGYAFLTSLFDGSYYCDLLPTTAQAWVAISPLPDGVQTASIATDADVDDDGVLSEEESAGFVSADPAQARVLANFMYDLVGRVAGVKVTTVAVPGMPDSVQIDGILAPGLQRNDAIVTVDSSAQYPLFAGIDGWHHLNVHAAVNGEAIAIEAQTAGDLLDWRVQ